eukprot:CAMPEP_0113565894 /NCGR_PEP_ID=MMETSP0015_2-20120614/22426_1 /TAXON_ID=2838 /ORGANISM="Odontella" /LENGTH=277 /DNA_ID=CAMNT_0000468133 /DNA_START=57 /DNA_END=886 /DNA_ORIENTATION=+ /assembly_acc=CAM_ASM_000160
MMRWRSANADAEEGSSSGAAPDTGAAALATSGLHSAGEADPSPGESSTNGFDADDRERRRRRRRLELSPVSRTALTIRAMAGAGAGPAAAARPKSSGGGGDSPPPAPPWTFSSLSSPGECAEDEGGGGAPSAEEAATTTPPDEDDRDDQDNMPIEGILADPIHYHSFVPDSSLLRPLWGTVRRCAGCGDRLRTLFGGAASSGGGGGGGGGGAGTDGQTVRCAACGILAHRRCAFSSRAIQGGCGSTPSGVAVKAEMPVCEVNCPMAEALERRARRRG